MAATSVVKASAAGLKATNKYVGERKKQLRHGIYMGMGAVT